MKALKYIAAIALLAGLVSCQQELSQGVQAPASEPDMVELSFNVQFPELIPVGTKGTMGEYPDANDFNVYLCLYGSGKGYVQNWIKAKTVSITPGTNNTKGTFVVKLPITDEKRVVHIMVNPPLEVDSSTGEVLFPLSDYEYMVMEKMVTENEECSYWQEIVLEHGIQATLNGNNEWVPDSDLVEAFSNVHLVRNFAKVTVIGNPNEDFTVGRWTLINVPTKAYVAPYNGEEIVTFPKGYTNISQYPDGDALLAQLTGYDPEGQFNYPNPDYYPGYLPPEAVINTVFPGDPETVPDAYADASTSGSLYMYERPLPTTDQKQTAVLVEVTFGQDHSLTLAYNEQNGTDVDHVTYWYKIEILDDKGQYVPFLRNIAYVLKIDGIEEAGRDTAEEAYGGSYFGNISASLETASLSDLSNGVSLIHVDQLDYTFIQGGTDELLMVNGEAALFWYQPDNTLEEYFYANGTASNGDAIQVSVTLLDGGNAVTAVKSNEEAAGDGTIKVTLAETGTQIKKSIIRVSGKNLTTNKELYREITINLMDKQSFAHGDDVTCISNTSPISDESNQEVDITVYLPEGLGASLFPIQIRIEAENNSLTTTSPDLPLSTGKSVFNSERNTYFFIKTIKYSDYCWLDPRTKKYKYNYEFPMTFYTSKSSGNSTQIYIGDMATEPCFNPTTLTLEAVAPTP